MDYGSVAAILHGRTLVSLPPGVTLRQAAKVMADHGIGAVAVVQADVLVGIFTERDLMKRVVVPGLDIDTMRLDQAMTRNPVTVPPDCRINDALAIMIEGGFRHLPVTADGRLAGMISLRDLQSLHLQACFDVVELGPISNKPAQPGLQPGPWHARTGWPPWRPVHDCCSSAATGVACKTFVQYRMFLFPLSCWGCYSPTCQVGIGPQDPQALR